MTNQDTAYLKATIREQRAELERLTADNDHLAQVVGQQSARLEEQAREMVKVKADREHYRVLWEGEHCPTCFGPCGGCDGDE